MENSRRIFSRYEVNFLIKVFYILLIGIINMVLVDNFVFYYKYIFAIPNSIILLCLIFYYYKFVMEVKNKEVND